MKKIKKGSRTFKAVLFVKASSNYCALKATILLELLHTAAVPGTESSLKMSRREEFIIHYLDIMTWTPCIVSVDTSASA